MKRVDTAILAAMVGFFLCAVASVRGWPWWAWCLLALLMVPAAIWAAKEIRSDRAQERTDNAVIDRMRQRDPAPFHRYDSRRGA